VSRSPDTADTETADDYLLAFERTFRLHEQGMSFSGREPNCVFLNTGNKQFANVSATSGLDFPDDGRGLAVVDWDHDGDLDLWFANRTAPQARFLRNDLDGLGDSVSFRLEGRKGNRDGIGSRLELLARTPAGESVRLSRSLRAGEGFLSQSTKWVHFGLGSGMRPERLTVRWSGAGSETFEDLQANRFYRLVEGSGKAVEWSPPERRVELAASRLTPQEPITPERAVLASPAPLPPLAHRTFDGDVVELHPGLKAPLFLNLWATWCLPCHAELGDLVAKAEALRALGLQVLALSVDGLDEEKATSATDAQRFLADLGFPFASGLADEELLTKLQLLHDRLFSIRLELAVPTSFLIDGEGRLAVIYRGPVDPDRLLEDTRNLVAGLPQRRLMATPLAGRWLGPPQALRVTSIARRFLEEGLAEDAVHYLRLAVDQEPEDALLQASLADLLAGSGQTEEAISLYRQAVLLDPGAARLSWKLADLLSTTGRDAEALPHYARAGEAGTTSARFHHGYGLALERLGRADEAAAELRRALEREPGFPPAHYSLGVLFLRAGQVPEAIHQLERALVGDPSLADAHNNLGVAFLHQGEIEEAEQHLRAALDLRPDLAAAHNNLGALLLQRKEVAEAIEHFRRALEIDPDHVDARENLEAAQRLAEED
jgi:Tfp pilus assembly protein PilF/peroxiredoxin